MSLEFELPDNFDGNQFRSIMLRAGFLNTDMFAFYVVQEDDDEDGNFTHKLVFSDDFGPADHVKLQGLLDGYASQGPSTTIEQAVEGLESLRQLVAQQQEVIEQLLLEQLLGDLGDLGDLGL